MKEDLIEQLLNRLDQPLPGEEAQRLMTPEGLRDERFRNPSIHTAKLSGVLVLLYKKDSEWHIPLTLRNEYKGTHSGQVSFPGGKKEQGDPDLMATALREANEEVGIEPSEVQVMGQLTNLYIPPSNFKVVPTLAYLQERPIFKLDTFEVKELIEVPLSLLQDSATIKTKPMSFVNGYSVQMPYFDVYGHVVWGATAMILSELVTILDTN